MKDLKRRNFLKYAGIGGVLALSKITPLVFLENAFSEEVKEVKLNASVTTVNAGTGKSFKAWTYNGQLPGPEIRIKEGETLRAVLKNYLPEGTTIHWHGLPVPNNMDGVPGITQSPVQPGQSFVYEFNATPPGTYIYHTHASYQLDQGLYDDNLNRLRLNDYNLLDGIEEPFVKPVDRVDKTFRMTLSGGMMGSPYWTINGKVYPYTDNIDIRDGEKIRFEYFNMSMMPHPMHLHGHFFEVAGSGRSTGIRIKKDTLIIPPHMGSGAIEFIASNPGVWFHHCHNLYHMEGGMANLVRILQ